MEKRKKVVLVVLSSGIAGLVASLLITFRQFMYAYPLYRNFRRFYPDTDTAMRLAISSLIESFKQLGTLWAIAALGIMVVFSILFLAQKLFFSGKYVSFVKAFIFSLFCLSCFRFGIYLGNDYSLPELVVFIVFLALPVILLFYVFLSTEIFGPALYPRIEVGLVFFYAFWSASYFLMGGAASNFNLESRISMLNLSGICGLALFSIFLGWYAAIPRKKVILYGACLIFSFFAAALMYMNSALYYPVMDSERDSILSLPYVAWSPIGRKDLDKKGVTLYEPDLSYEGLNLFFCEIKNSKRYLMDMEGNPVHKFKDKTGRRWTWKYMKRYGPDDFLVLVEDKALFRISRDSTVKWLLEKRLHHYITVDQEGDIYAISNTLSYSPRYSLLQPITDNHIVVIGGDGELKKKHASLARATYRNKRLFHLAKHQRGKRRVYNKEAWDVFHTNSVRVIPKDVYKGNKRLFKKGDVLVCFRNLNCIAVIDMENQKAIWHWGDQELEMPHDAVFLENGNISIFDNGARRKYSRVIELNPVTEKIEWEYKGNPLRSFFSKTRGGAQKLPNGNMLITETDKGRVFEITKDGKIVWDFYSPQMHARRRKRATIFRMTRITAEKSLAE
jgi:hypothetical protein